MSDSHKAALAEGREQGRAVRRYLEALEAHRPKRGRKRTQESVERRLTAIDDKLNDADALTRLHLSQERMNLQAELSSTDNAVDLGALEEEFVVRGQAVRRAQGHHLRRVAAGGGRPQRAAQGRHQAGRRVAAGAAEQAGRQRLARRIGRQQALAAAAVRRRSPEGCRTPVRGAASARTTLPSGRTDAGDVVDRPVGVVDDSAGRSGRRRAIRPTRRASRCNCPQSG